MGKTVGAFGLTEPNHGSDPGGMETNAKFCDVERCYKLNGTKSWFVMLFIYTREISRVAICHGIGKFLKKS